MSWVVIRSCAAERCTVPSKVCAPLQACVRAPSPFFSSAKEDDRR